MQYVILTLLTMFFGLWCYKTGTIVGYEQGYDDGLRRGFTQGRAARKQLDAMENHR